jgi:ribosomal protein L11 methylase PrmA
MENTIPILTDAEELLGEAQQLCYEIKKANYLYHIEEPLKYKKWMKEVLHYVKLMLFEDGIIVNTEMRKKRNEDILEITFWRPHVKN